jgi:hypothetical protein
MNFPSGARRVRIPPVASQHISDDDLELYYLGKVAAESELALLEEHLLGCPDCVRRAKETETYIDAMRAAIIAGNFDLE